MLLSGGCKAREHALSVEDHPAASGPFSRSPSPGMAVRHHVERAFGMPWNRCSRSSETAVRDGVDYASSGSPRPAGWVGSAKPSTAAAPQGKRPWRATRAFSVVASTPGLCPPSRRRGHDRRHRSQPHARGRAPGLGSQGVTGGRMDEQTGRPSPCTNTVLSGSQSALRTGSATRKSAASDIRRYALWCDQRSGGFRRPHHQEADAGRNPCTSPVRRDRNWDPSLAWISRGSARPSTGARHWRDRPRQS